MCLQANTQSKNVSYTKNPDPVFSGNTDIVTRQVKDIIDYATMADSYDQFLKSMAPAEQTTHTKTIQPTHAVAPTKPLPGFPVAPQPMNPMQASAAVNAQNARYETIPGVLPRPVQKYDQNLRYDANTSFVYDPPKSDVRPMPSVDLYNQFKAFTPDMAAQYITALINEFNSGTGIADALGARGLRDVVGYSTALRGVKPANIQKDQSTPPPITGTQEVAGGSKTFMGGEQLKKPIYTQNAGNLASAVRVVA